MPKMEAKHQHTNVVAPWTLRARAPRWWTRGPADQVPLPPRPEQGSTPGTEAALTEGSRGQASRPPSQPRDTHSRGSAGTHSGRHGRAGGPCVGTAHELAKGPGRVTYGLSGATPSQSASLAVPPRMSWNLQAPLEGTC